MKALFIFLLSFHIYGSGKEQKLFDGEYDSVDLASVTPKVGHISKLRLEKVDLTNFNDLEKFCNGSRINVMFGDCYDRLSGIKLWRSPHQEDLTPWIMPQNQPFFSAGSNRQKQSDMFRVLIDNRGGIPEWSRPFAPHLVAIKNAYVSKWGFIFDNKRLYNYGGCANKGWDEPTLEVDLWKYQVGIASLMPTTVKPFFHCR